MIKTNDLYLKSGSYICTICKNHFTAHTRLFLCKEKKYACPYCKSTDFLEQEFFNVNNK